MIALHKFLGRQQHAEGSRKRLSRDRGSLHPDPKGVAPSAIGSVSSSRGHAWRPDQAIILARAGFGSIHMNASVIAPTRIAPPAMRFSWNDGWTLLSICALAVAVRAAVMLLFPSIAYPDEIFQYLEPANRLIHGAGLVTWEYEVGARSWLLPGLLAGCMAVGELFGSAPAASLAAVSVLLCVLSLGPVICGFLWGRRYAGFAGAVTAGLLNAAWFELVYFSTHVLAETFAAAALMVGLYLVYPGRTTPPERRLFAGAVLMGLAVVIRPQLAPAVAIAVVAICGIRARAHYPAMLAGLAAPILLSGLLDWITWGWPFQSLALSIYYNSFAEVASFFSTSPLLAYVGWEWVYWGPIGIVIVLCALYGGVRLPLLLLMAAAIFVVHSAIAHKEHRFISPALPLMMTLAGIGSILAADWIGRRVNRVVVRQALTTAVPVAWIIASLTLAVSQQRAWFWLRDRGSILAMRAIDADPNACGVAILPGSLWDRNAGYVHLRPGLSLYDAGGLTDTRAFNYMISYQRVQPASNGPPVPSLSGAGYQEIQCWQDPEDRHGKLERICLWQRPGACAKSSSQLLATTTAAGFPVHRPH